MGKKLSGKNLLAYSFLRYISQKYPSIDNTLKFARVFGYEENVEAQIILFSTFRDALRKVSPDLFHSPEHREEVLITLMETIEELEKILEEDEYEEMPEDREGIILP